MKAGIIHQQVQREKTLFLEDDGSSIMTLALSCLPKVSFLHCFNVVWSFNNKNTELTLLALSLGEFFYP